MACETPRGVPPSDGVKRETRMSPCACAPQVMVTGLPVLEMQSQTTRAAPRCLETARSSSAALVPISGRARHRGLVVSGAQMTVGIANASPRPASHSMTPICLLTTHASFTCTAVVSGSQMPSNMQTSRSRCPECPGYVLAAMVDRSQCSNNGCRPTGCDRRPEPRTLFAPWSTLIN